MKILVEELLKNSFVITINDNRYNDFCKRLSDENFDISLIKKFRGCQLKNGFYDKQKLIKTGNMLNCSISHLNIIQIAKYLDLDYCCIFEDDCIPCINCYEKLQDVLNDIPNDLDILKLGQIYNSNVISNVNSKLIRYQNTYGSHAYIIFKKYYDKYIELWDTNFVADDLVLNDINSIIYSVKNILFIQDIYNYTDSIHNNHGQQCVFKTINPVYVKENFKI